MTMTTLVLQRGEARFNMVGQKLPDSLHDTNQQISQGLAKRLRHHALRRLTELGFAVGNWDCEVCTADADRPPADRYYHVDFINEKGGKLGVQGILTNKGWPNMDHGLTIGA